MRTWTRYALAAAALLVVFAVVAQTHGPTPEDRTARSRPTDVVLMRCDPTGAELSLQAYKGSAGTPAQKSGNCAENLSVLLKDGFVIRDIGHYREEKSGFVFYTLIR